MDINLKVSPAELEAKATDFKGVMSQIKTLTDDMMADVTGLSSTWTGDASSVNLKASNGQARVAKMEVTYTK